MLGGPLTSDTPISSHACSAVSAPSRSPVMMASFSALLASPSVWLTSQLGLCAWLPAHTTQQTTQFITQSAIDDPN